MPMPQSLTEHCIAAGWFRPGHWTDGDREVLLKLLDHNMNRQGNSETESVTDTTLPQFSLPAHPPIPTPGALPASPPPPIPPRPAVIPSHPPTRMPGAPAASPPPPIPPRPTGIPAHPRNFTTLPSTRTPLPGPPASHSQTTTPSTEAEETARLQFMLPLFAALIATAAYEHAAQPSQRRAPSSSTSTSHPPASPITATTTAVALRIPPSPISPTAASAGGSQHRPTLTSATLARTPMPGAPPTVFRQM
ncbi:hypothetical protein BJ508DRAFT_132075 [Ascobolus immersus RN42]|uniref:Uncharacterized protein n=1 Tax=Ascobolus immersus RN42 TaxID=1160509 RepID=A0A3N4I7D2_ASCIM|nr:hypothetical protein BJ508DRAFT_132075 [Ascobolus immersus RN42]